MKRFIDFAGLAVLLAGTFASCTKEGNTKVEVPAPQLLTFSFTAEANPEHISKTADGKISGADVTVDLPQLTDLTKLVATFTTGEGNKVTVDGVEQVSGVTANDFTNPVDYVITNSDGSVNALYSVSINKTTGEWTAVAEPFGLTPIYNGIVMKVNPKDNLPYFAYKERVVVGTEAGATGNRISVLKYENSGWTFVGQQGFSPAVYGSELDLDFDSKGTPYVAFQNDELTPKSASVMKFDGAWTLVGTSPMNDAASTKVHFNVLSENEIVLGQVNSNKNSASFARNAFVASVFNGSTWENVANPALAANFLVYDNSSCKSGDAVYFAHINRGTIDNVAYGNNVVKYQKGQWTALRTNFVQSGATQTGITSLDIAATEDGSVYLLTSDNAPDGTSYRIRVEKYEPAKGEWTTVGGNPIDYVIDKYNSARLAIAPDGTPFVAYRKTAGTETSVEVVYLDSKTKQWSAPSVLGLNSTPGEISLEFNSFGTAYLGYLATDGKYNVYKFE